MAAAERDPEGARQALFALGELLGWPPGGIPPIPTNQGQVSWRTALNKYPPGWLGIAWAKAERRYRQVLAQVQRNTAEGQMPESQVQGEAEVKVQPTKGLDVGFYPCLIREITETTSEFTDKQTGKAKQVPQFVFQFVVLDDDNAETDDEMRGYCTISWGQRSKLYKWAQAILRGKCPQPNEEFDSDLLLRKRCDIEVALNTIGNPKVENLFPFRAMSAAPSDDGDEAPVKGRAKVAGAV